MQLEPAPVLTKSLAKKLNAARKIAEEQHRQHQQYLARSAKKQRQEEHRDGRLAAPGSPSTERKRAANRERASKCYKKKALAAKEIAAPSAAAQVGMWLLD